MPDKKDTMQKLVLSLKRQTILADISQNLLSLDNFADKINESLKIIGNHSGFSRLYIFEDSEDGSSTSNTFEWCNEGIKPQIDELQDIPYEIIPSWKKILNEKGKVFAQNIYELPDDIIAILEPQGIKSILVLPLCVQNKFFGFVGFDECVTNRSWESKEIDLLRTVAGIFSNSFERLIYQRKLKESEIRLKLAIESTGAGLWDWNIKTGHVYFSDTWLKMKGYKRGDLEPHVSTWEGLLHPDDRAGVIANLKKHLSGDAEIYEATHRMHNKNGQWSWMLDKGRVIEYDKKGAPLRAVGMHIDITEQKLREAELEKLNATKDKLFSIIAHDLRGPIGTIMQVSEYLADNDNLSTIEIRNFLQSQKQLTRSTFRMLDNLLNWAKLNRDAIRVNAENFSLKELIQINYHEMEFALRKKNIVFENIENDAYFAFADREMINIVIRNLLSNSLKFTHAGGRIWVEITKNEDFYAVKICDNGVGIAEEDIIKILSDSKYHSSYGTNYEKGSGIGLKLCKNFVEMNRGKLTIESEAGKGTCMVFTVPAV